MQFPHAFTFTPTFHWLISTACFVSLSWSSLPKEARQLWQPFNNLELIWTYNTCNLQFTKTLVFTNAKKPTAAWWACMFVVTFASKKCGSTTPFLSGHSFLKSGGALDYSPAQIRISHTQETTHSKQHCLLLGKSCTWRESMLQHNPQIINYSKPASWPVKSKTYFSMYMS